MEKPIGEEKAALRDKWRKETEVVLGVSEFYSTSLDIELRAELEGD